MGYPMIIVIGKEAAGTDGKYELHFTGTENVLRLSLNELLLEVNKKIDLHRYRWCLNDIQMYSNSVESFKVE